MEMEVYGSWGRLLGLEFGREGRFLVEFGTLEEFGEEFLSLIPFLLEEVEIFLNSVHLALHTLPFLCFPVELQEALLSQPFNLIIEHLHSPIYPIIVPIIPLF